MHADGAGTKGSLAYLYWKETGDISVFKGISQDSIVMNIDDLMCVGATNGTILISVRPSKIVLTSLEPFFIYIVTLRVYFYILKSDIINI